MNDIDRSDIPSARFPNLFSVKTVIEQGKQLAKTYQVTVVALDDIVVKYGRRVYKSEALAMQLVRDAATDVPLPQLHAYFTEMAKDLNGEGRCGYLVMEKVPGIPLIEALPRLDEQSCDNIASQLQTYVSSLCSIDSAGKWGHSRQERYLPRRALSLPPSAIYKGGAGLRQSVYRHLH